MKIEISEKGSYDYYNEFLFLCNNYRKIYSNPTLKIKKMSFIAYIYLIISFVIFSIFLVLYLNFNETIELGVTIFFGLLIILSIVYLVLIKNKIKKLFDASVITNFEITDAYVGIENKNGDYKLNFDEIKCIIIGNYTISFIPKDVSQKFICTRIDYKDEIIKELQKYNKESLIIK